MKEDVDVVYVLTPNNAHAPVSIAAMKAGKHVMCEKPMAKTYAEAKEMVKTAKETGKILTIGYQHRYRADSQYLKSACEADELGEIYYAKAHAIRRRAVPTSNSLSTFQQRNTPGLFCVASFVSGFSVRSICVAATNAIFWSFTIK